MGVPMLGLVLAALLTATTPAMAPVGVTPVQLTSAEHDSLLKASAKDREATANWLKTAPTSYLATIQRVDFDGRTKLVIGSAADCDVRMPAGSVAAHALSVAVAGDSFHVAALDDTTTFAWKDLAFHEATLPPTGISLGRFALRLSHQRFPAIIVFDPQSPRFADYHGVDYFAWDPAYRFVVSLRPDLKADTTIIMSTRGNARRALRVGWFDLQIGGHTVSLEAHRLLEPGVGESSVSLFFRDATTGKESYGVGRYVDPEHQEDGRWLVDFNGAYSPACAFSPHYNCPIPSKANRLAVAVRAGEKDSHYAH